MTQAAIEKSLFCRISKVDEEKRTVTGIGASEAIDAEGEIFDYDSSKPYIEGWSASAVTRSKGKSYGNIREMHQLSAVAKLNEPVVFDDTQKLVILTSYVGDDAAWQKCLDGIYTGFSICGPVVGDKWSDAGQPGIKRFTCAPIEFSLVDLPCNPEAVFTAVKAGGITEERKFKTAAAVEEEPTVAVAQKSMYSICDLVSVISSLRWVQDDLAWEADYEGDASPIPDKLKSALTDLCAVLVDLTREETSEMVTTMKARGAAVISKRLTPVPKESDANKAAEVATEVPNPNVGGSPEIEDEMDEATKAQIAAAETNAAKALELAQATNTGMEQIAKALAGLTSLISGEAVAPKSVTSAATVVVGKAAEMGVTAQVAVAGSSTPESVAKSILSAPRAVSMNELSTLRIGR